MDTKKWNVKFIDVFNDALLKIEKGVAVFLSSAIIFIVLIALLRLLQEIYDSLFLNFFAGKNNTFAVYSDIFGKIINLLISIEFMTSIVKVLKTHEVRILILDVSLITGLAICRKLIIFDYEHSDGHLIIGMALLLIGLGIFYFLVKFEPFKKNISK